MAFLSSEPSETGALFIAILIPMLGRPQAVDSLLASLGSTPHSVHFLCSPSDHEVIAACRYAALEYHGVSVRVVPWEPGPGDWARKINLGFRETREPFLLLGASDLRFHPGWDEAALRVASKTGAGVIGTNDLGNRTVMAGKHSTHPLVRRLYIEEYGTIDEPGQVLHESYAHQWVDTELVETARKRGQWAFAADSHVEHLHPFWKKGAMDSTYEKALSTSREDHRLFMQRRRLWR